jgi:hypothetical protein
MLFVPQIKKNLKWGCARIKQIITAVVTKTLTADLNLIVFFSTHFTLLHLFCGTKRKDLKNKLKLGFQFESNYSVTVVCNDPPKGSLHPCFMINQ